MHTATPHLSDSELQQALLEGTLTPGVPSRSVSRRTAPRVNVSRIVAGCVGLIIGGFVWVLGARYTIDGLMVVINWMLSFLTIPARISLPLPWQMYLILVPIPVVYSIVEWNNAPRQRIGNRITWTPVELICVWAVLGGMDLATTFFGLGTPANNALMIFIATNIVARGVATGFLTFWPEWLAKRMIQIIQSEWRKR